MRRRAIVSMLLVLIVLVAATPARPAGPLAHREMLPNGIVLLVAERPGVPIVITRAYTRAGSVLDPPDKPGLANLTADLLTRGTEKRSGVELDQTIEFVGGALEAGAGQDGIGVSLSVLKRDFALGLDLMREVMLAPTFPEAELQRKVSEIQAAIRRSEEDPQSVAVRAVAPLVFPGHPYGRRVYGTPESVARLTRDDVVKFYRESVRPDATIVAVAGDVTVDEARREVLARFGAWPRPATPLPVIPKARPGGSPRSESITRALSQATIMMGRQAINQTDPEYFPLAVASYILGGGSTSRLYVRLREQGGLVYGAFGYASPGKYGSAYYVSAQTRTAEIAKVLHQIREELDRLRKEPVSAAELQLAKDYLIGSYPFRLDTTAKVAGFIVSIEDAGLGLDYPDRYKAAVARVTAADVMRVANRFFVPGSFDQVVVGDVPASNGR
ncbi:MAG: insulinase family protein [Candidatus Rokubacteria bacterium]|nr:insulinase family protein [Candidatus Rokubacteria bacterium]MBI3826130.1 insulinase family protein [Candidatus Rokubacteria bacterium]